MATPGACASGIVTATLPVQQSAKYSRIRILLYFAECCGGPTPCTAGLTGPSRPVRGWRHCPRLRRATGRLHPTAGGLQLPAPRSCPNRAGARFSFGLAFSCPGVPYYMILCVLAGQPTYTYGTRHGTQRDTAGPVGHGRARIRDTTPAAGHSETGLCPAPCPGINARSEPVFEGLGHGDTKTYTPFREKLRATGAAPKARAMPPYPTTHHSEPGIRPRPGDDRPARDLGDARPACGRATDAATHNAGTPGPCGLPAPAPQPFLFLALGRDCRVLVALSHPPVTCCFAGRRDKATSTRQAPAVRGATEGDKRERAETDSSQAENVRGGVLSLVACRLSGGQQEIRKPGFRAPETVPLSPDKRQDDRHGAPYHHAPLQIRFRCRNQATDLEGDLTA